MRSVRFLGAILLVLGLCRLAHGGAVVTLNEFGNGTLAITGQPTITLTSAMAADPYPGGLSQVLTYYLPFNPLPGDVLLTENGIPRAVLRFNPGTGGGLASTAFYSDGTTTPADVPSPPQPLYPNTVNVPMIVYAGGGGAYYTPTSIQPGFAMYQSLPVSYHFISFNDVVVPLPSTVGLGAAGLAVLVLVRLVRRRRSS